MKEHRQENNHIEKGLCRLERYKFGQKIAHADNIKRIEKARPHTRGTLKNQSPGS